MSNGIANWAVAMNGSSPMHVEQRGCTPWRDGPMLSASLGACDGQARTRCSSSGRGRGDGRDSDEALTWAKKNDKRFLTFDPTAPGERSVTRLSAGSATHDRSAFTAASTFGISVVPRLAINVS